MTYIAVKNFGEFQHYKDRRPPWIKLYNELLDNYDFLALPEVLQRHLVMIWLIASRHENRIPDDLTYLAHAIHAKGKVDFASLFASGWLIRVEQSDSEPLAQPGQDASNGASTPIAERSKNAIPHARGRASREVETETETEKETTTASPPVGGKEVATEGESTVLEHYKARHPKRKPEKNPKNLRLIRRQLVNYSVAELCRAIDGNADDEWHRSQGLHDLDYVLRNADKIDKFIALEQQPARPPNGRGGVANRSFANALEAVRDL